jgi:hypothetical protein
MSGRAMGIINGDQTTSSAQIGGSVQ